VPHLTIAVTGATGLLGSHLAAALLARGDDVAALSRARPTSGPSRWYRWAMPDAPPPSALEGADVLVHCAYETRATDPARAYAVNVEGSRRLIDAAHERGVRVVFISSLSAHEQAISAYGRSKLAVEAMLGPSLDLAVRPGLIVARGGSGLYGRMRTVIERSRLIPLPYGGRQLIQTIAIGDLVEGILRAIDRGITGVLMIADPRPVPIEEMYREMARASGVRPIFVRVPGAPLLVALRALEALRLRLPITSENLLGLRQLRAFDVRGDLARIDLEPRPMREAIATSG
jgi:nucleoside-diphosphate-sugar epimerase